MIVLFIMCVESVHEKKKHKIKVTTGKHGKKKRKLMITPVVMFDIQEKSQVFHRNKWQFKTISGGKISLVLPRDPPTTVINQLPMRGFQLNPRANEPDKLDIDGNYHTYDRYLLDDKAQQPINKTLI